MGSPESLWMFRSDRTWDYPKIARTARLQAFSRVALKMKGRIKPVNTRRPWCGTSDESFVSFFMSAHVPFIFIILVNTRSTGEFPSHRIQCSLQRGWPGGARIDAFGRSSACRVALGRSGSLRLPHSGRRLGRYPLRVSRPALRAPRRIPGLDRRVRAQASVLRDQAG